MRFLFFFLIAFLLVSCREEQPKLFQKVPASETGITFVNELDPSPALNILTYLYYYNGAGVATADFNNDSLPDLYFTSNQGSDKLYLNKGNFKFEDISKAAGILNLGTWSTGVTHVDINSDGLLDIYVCKASQYRALTGRNLLYINQGNNEKGIPQFKEEAASYGLDFAGLSTQAAFFDYDLDGDLDLFLLNHSVHPNNAYGYGSQRKQFDAKSGDRLFRNDGQRFIDVSEEAGIFQGKIGFGLGVGIADLNQDGYPDIYVGNDFFENDYLYLNTGEGTFKDIVSTEPEKIGHTSHYSMGNDLADMNNDGRVDILSMDMLPRNQETYKTSGLDYPYPIYENYLKNGYAPQYMQNTLQLNLGNANFSEIGHLSGISATEWSWGVLAADYDNDGLKDLFITNGIKGATNDMDFVQFISNDIIQKGIDNGMSQKDMALVNKLPEVKVPNYFYRNLGNLEFQEVTAAWSVPEATFSNGCVYTDLDNDGDLDIVINDVNGQATLLRNQSNTPEKYNYLKIQFTGHPQNTFGFGAKIIAYDEGRILYHENNPTRGYLSAVAPTIHLGLGNATQIDSVKVIWPNRSFQTLYQVKANQKLTVNFNEAHGNFYEAKRTVEKSYLSNADSLFSFRHKEPPTVEFLRNPIAPWANTNEGPDISVTDTNGDGLDDVFISGAKGQTSQLLLQTAQGKFTRSQQELFQEDKRSEDVSHVFFDANGDGTEDLLVGSGGNEFTSGKPLQPRLYLNIKGTFVKDTLQFQDIAINVAKVGVVDIENDGDVDIFLAADQVPLQFGKTPAHYLFENDGTGNFKLANAYWFPESNDIGNIKDFEWVDIDSNGYPDLVAIGHWMPVTIFLNNGTQLTRRNKNGLDRTHGLWNSLICADFDNDGDIDLIAGNWGLNSKLRASKEYPLTLYNYDFDDNGQIDPVVTYFHDGIETPFASKDELVKQMPFLNKEFLSYKSFAQASLTDLFGDSKLRKADKKQVYELGSMYFQNEGNGMFSAKKLPQIAQTSTLNAMTLEDFDQDGFKDVLIVGNDYEISTQLGRMDALHGVILHNDKKGGFQWLADQDFNISGPARSIAKIAVNDTTYYLVGMNNGPMKTLQLQIDKKNENDD